MAHSDCITILLVEDQALIAMAETAQLEKRGYRVITAFTGEEAVLLADSQEDIDLILMDIDLGKAKIDGTEAARRILARHELPVVFLSSHTEPEMVDRTEEITSYGYIVKNTGFTVLETSIKMALKLFQAHQEVKRHREETQRANALLAESREDLQATLHSIGDAVFSTDIFGSVSRMNPVAEELTGWTLREAQGKHYKDVFRIIHAHTRNEADDPIRKALDKGTVVGLANHTLLISKEGLEYQIADSASPIRDDQGSIRGAVVVFRDVTDAYRIREDLQKSEDRLSKVMAAAQDGFWDWNLLTGQIYFDPRYYTMAGYEPGEFPGTYQAFQERVHPEDISPVEEAIKIHFSGKSDRFDVEFRFLRKDSGWMWIRGRGMIVERNEKGEPTRFVGSHADITRWKEAEKASEAMKENLCSLLIILESLCPVGDSGEIPFTFSIKSDEVVISITKDPLKPQKKFIRKASDYQVLENLRNLVKDLGGSINRHRDNSGGFEIRFPLNRDTIRAPRIGRPVYHETK